jgi:hypothetical protein
MISETKLRKIRSGATLQLSYPELEYIYDNMPNLSQSNQKKIEKAFKGGKGCRINFDVEGGELEGSGFLKSAKKGLMKGARFLHDTGIDDILIDEAINYAPIPGTAKRVASKVAKKQVDRMMDGKGLSGGNKYMPDSLKGGSLMRPSNFKVYSDNKNVVRPDQPSFTGVRKEFLPLPSNYNPRTHGAGFKVNT